MAPEAEPSSPAPGGFLTAEWRWLVMLNYEVEPRVLQELVPRGTELDLWQGRALVSMVAFRFLDTRVLGLPIPFHRDFDEVNLRFYVTRASSEGVKRGVVFVKEIVPRFAIAWTARTFYNENYVSMPMRHELHLPQGDGDGAVRYEWRHAGRWNRLGAAFTGAPALAPDDSEETFISEHYWGYAAQPDGSTVEYQVEHPRWRVWKATHPELDCDAGELYGRQLEPFLGGPPTSAFVAEGSPVRVRRGRRLKP